MMENWDPVLARPLGFQDCQDLWDSGLLGFPGPIGLLWSPEPIWELWNSVLNYVPCVTTCFTCSRACVPSCHCLVLAFNFLRALRALIFYMSYLPSFFTCLHFLKCPTCPHFFTCLTCPHFLHAFIFSRAWRAFIFLPAFILFIYMLIKHTQINELSNDCLSLLLLNSVIYQRLSSVFHLSCYILHYFFFFLKQKILSTVNAEGTPNLLKDSNIIWNEKFREC